MTPSARGLDESYHEYRLLGQLDRQMANWLVLGSLGMMGTNDCSHGMTESLLMADLDVFYRTDRRLRDTIVYEISTES